MTETTNPDGGLMSSPRLASLRAMIADGNSSMTFQSDQPAPLQTPGAALDERERFELWFSDAGKSPKAIERSGDGYRLMQAHQAWIAWQAALTQGPASDARDEHGSDIEKAMATQAAPFEAFLQDQDAHALHRFVECCEDFDSGGHDVRKEEMRRLTEIGVVRSCGFGRHEITAFGSWVHDGAWLQPVNLPLLTHSEALERAAIATPKGSAA